MKKSIMFSPAKALALLSLPLSVLAAGQFPEFNGVIGGLPRLQDANQAKAHPKVLSVAAANTTTPGALRVTENSGVCETTSGVYQASGYGDITATKSIFFWFFAARNNSDTAPLALWFNGGPGSSSMIGLIQEHGPCRIKNDSSTVEHNPYSWNTNANVLYIDQPVGVGFSYGDLQVNSSSQAAVEIWSFLQIWLNDSRFSKYQKNDLALWAESYGGHYGPAFAAHFLAQNDAIAAGTVSGLPLNLKVLGIGNGLTDALIQYPGLITYAQNNPYHPTTTPANISIVNTYWKSPAGCKEQIVNCQNSSADTLCFIAQLYCNTYILTALNTEYDVYDIRARNPDPYPPNFEKWLSSVRTKIGADIEWQQFSPGVYGNFALTGDWMRSYKPHLESVINAGVRTILFNGDADYIVNFHGVELLMDALQTKFTKEYKQQKWTDYKVAGQSTGQYKQAGTLSYLRVYGAGHLVPAYKYGTLATGQAALQFFDQITSGQSLSST